VSQIHPRKLPSSSFIHLTIQEDTESVVKRITITYILVKTASMVYWSEFLATDPEVSGSIPGATRFSEK
jgi:hypothetical protein